MADHQEPDEPKGDQHEQNQSNEGEDILDGARLPSEQQHFMRLEDATSLMIQNFASLLDAGLPLLRSIMVLEASETQPRLKQVLNEIAMEIEGGASLFESTKKYEDVFPQVFVSVVRAGEVGGVLDILINRYVDSDELSRELTGKPTVKRFQIPTETKLWALNLSTMVGAGVPILEALEHCSEGLSEPYKEATKKAIEQLREGDSLSDSLKDSKDLFPTPTMSIIDVGEATGELDRALLRIAKWK